MTDTTPLRILVSYPHPDDESFGPSAALAKYARAGAEIYGIFFTRGEGGDSHLRPRPTPMELAAYREADLRDATRVIGFREIEILDYADGGLADVSLAELEDHVRRAMTKWRPDIVLTFGPAGITNHPDHITIHRATAAVFHDLRRAESGPQALFYDAMPPERAIERGLEKQPDGQPNARIDVTESMSVKLEALRLHARHIADAGEAVKRLQREPRTEALLHRAWPPVTPGQIIRALEL
jgi:LmbE family N-acetylglucosaminyl deacetylase